jgi:hypothetical protein
MADPDITALREQLRQGCERVPIEKLQAWSRGEVVAFKTCVQAGKKVLAKQRPSVSELQAAINALANYWR